MWPRQSGVRISFKRSTPEMGRTNADVNEIVDLCHGRAGAREGPLEDWPCALREAGGRDRALGRFNRREGLFEEVQEGTEKTAEERYSVGHLGSLLRISVRFPAPTRRQDVHWTGHYRRGAG